MKKTFCGVLINVKKQSKSLRHVLVGFLFDSYYTKFSYIFNYADRTNRDRLGISNGIRNACTSLLAHTAFKHSVFDIRYGWRDHWMDQKKNPLGSLRKLGIGRADNSIRSALTHISIQLKNIGRSYSSADAFILQILRQPRGSDLL